MHAGLRHFNTRKTPIAAALLVFGTLPQGARAEEQLAVTANAASIELEAVQVSGDRPDSFKPEASTVGGKVETRLLDIPQTVTVINRSVLDAQNAITLTDALRNVPGITLTAGEGGQIGDNVNLRGFSARTDIYLDGSRDRAQYRRDTFELESVEVLKGPSSLFFGRGSTGGVINQVTKVPTLRSFQSITGSIGSDDWYRSTIDVNQRLSEDSAFRLNAFAQDISSTRDEVETKGYGFAPSFRFGIGSQTEITLSGLVQRNDDVPDYGIPFAFGQPARVSLDNYYGDTDDFYKQQANVFRARIDQTFSEVFSLRNQLFVAETDIQARPTPYRVCTAAFNTAATPCPVSPVGTPIDQITVQSDRRDRRVDDLTVYDQVDFIAKFDTGPIKHVLVFGGEAGEDRTRNQSFTTTPRVTQSLGNFIPQPTRPGTRRIANTDTRGTGDTLALYVNDAITLTPQIKAVAGLRWDRYDAESNALAVQTGVRTRFDRIDKEVSYRGGLIWQPVSWQSYYASYGTSFNPTAEAVTISAAQASVAPEKNRSYEVGTKIDLFDGELLLGGAVFLIEKQNARTTDPVTNTVQLDGNTQVRGFELSAVGHITKPWQVIAGYTYLDSELVDTLDGTGTGAARISFEGNDLANVPRNAASLFTTYTFLRNFEAGGGAYYVGKRFITTANITSVDSYVRTDLTLAWKQPKYVLRLNVQNLLDEKYFDAVVPSENGRAVPGRGTTVIGTVSVNL